MTLSHDVNTVNIVLVLLLLLLLQPVLRHYQEQKSSSFIERKTRERLELEGFVEPELKRRRSQDITPLDRTTSGVSKLPDLPDDLKRKQVNTVHVTTVKACPHQATNCCPKLLPETATICCRFVAVSLSGNNLLPFSATKLPGVDRPMRP